MKRPAGCLLTAVVLALCLPQPSAAQLSTPPPDVTAESEMWYSSGAPIDLGGIIYYPSGPITHFNRHEMVFTGLFDRIPIYRRTTQEPGSIVYVPLAGGLVRPYERRRSGELAGTVGSTPPSFPVALPAEELGEPAVDTEAAVPRPVGTAGFMYGSAEPARRTAAPPESGVPGPVGTAGSNRAAPLSMSAAPRRPARVETAQRPAGLNTVFIDFRYVRWYAAGRAVELSTGQFTKIGDYRGFPVYQESGRKDTIFVSLIPDEPSLVVPYKSH